MTVECDMRDRTIPAKDFFKKIEQLSPFLKRIARENWMNEFKDIPPSGYFVMQYINYMDDDRETENTIIQRLILLAGAFLHQGNIGENAKSFAEVASWLRKDNHIIDSRFKMVLDENDLNQHVHAILKAMKTKNLFCDLVNLFDDLLHFNNETKKRWSWYYYTTEKQRTELELEQ